MVQDRARSTVRARFAEREAARRAIAALERAGLPGSDIRLEGPPAEAAARQEDTSASDEAFMHEAEKTVFSGAAIGTGVGALIGLLVGLVLWGPTWPGIAIAVAGGGAAGGGFGFVVNAMVGFQQTDAAELTYHDVGDAGEDIYVAVHSERPADLEKAAGRLRSSGALSVEQLDAHGN